MKHQLQTIRAGLETATCYTMLGVDAHSVQTALTALTQLEAMVGEQEPVAKLHDDGYWTPMKTEAGRAVNDRLVCAGSPSIDVYTTPPAQQQQYEAGDMASAAAQGFRDGVASVAQQPQARPDFADEWTGYLKDGETPFERFLRERKDVQSVLKLYQRALEENERLKAQQPQAEAVPSDVVRDAEAYHWLTTTLTSPEPWVVFQKEFSHMTQERPPTKAELDAAIYAAIAQQKGGA